MIIRRSGVYNKPCAPNVRTRKSTLLSPGARVLVTRVMGAHARRIACLAAAVLLTQSVGVSLAARSATLRIVHYHGYEVRVPRSWPVYDLAKDPRVCVRFNRHAVYLGRPSAQQRCPADQALGRTEAILIEPIATAAAGAGAASNPLAPSSRETRFMVASAGVAVTATWSKDRGAVARALGRGSLPAPPAGAARANAAAGARAPARAHAAAVYTGLGFDPCSAPSPNAMAAWGSSPYRAIGIYIGGTNSACAQPNLTPQWVNSEVAAGWHLIPTYVGLQAPSNECGCAGITPSQASAQGTAAASDAVADAQALDIPAGNPIYFDMEAYSQTASNTSAVLSFLSAWTAGLHADGYVSGVYSSASSGISDLVSAGATFAKPDDIWIAEWNDAQSTASAFVPASDWSNHQRLHQYSGGHNETYGGVTINIDGDYLDGATAGSGGPPPPPPPPALGVSPAADGTTNLSMTWTGGGATSWEVWAGRSPNALTPIRATPARGVKTQVAVREAAPYFAAAPVASSGQTLTAAATAATPPHLAIFGRSAFVPAGGALVGVPAGCYTNAPCHVTTTVSAGRAVVGRTGPERVGSNGAGLLWFKLTPHGRTMLARARSRRLPVQVTARDASGAAATTTINLIPFSTTGRGPGRNLRQALPLRIVGTTDFVSSAGVGGILAGCFAVAPCLPRTTISVGRTVIARSGAEDIGGGELGYLIFTLTARGRTLLAHAGGNQLGARVSISGGAATATGQIALVGFS